MGPMRGNTIGKTLVIGPSWVGDMVMAQSLFMELERRADVGEIHVLAPAWAAPIVARMPQVKSHIATDFKHGELALSRRWKLAKAIQKQGFSRCLVLPNSLKAALIPWFARIPIRVGWLGEQRWGLLTDVRRLHKTSYPMTVQRFVALARPPGSAAVDAVELPVPALRCDPVAATKLAVKLGAKPANSNTLILCPGAEFGASKQWPARHYAALASHYLAQNWQVWLVGSPKDAAICSQINAATSAQCLDLSGQTSLTEALDLMSLAALVVSNDSGLMHIAAALNRPLVAVYGSTDPGHTPPLSPNHAIARLNLECSPCFKRECPLQHTNCLTQLPAARVIELADKLVASKS